MDRITPLESAEQSMLCEMDACGNPGRNKLMGKWYCSFHSSHLFQVKHESFEDFMEQARELVEGKAKEKGYNEAGAGKNDLMEFTNKFFPGHAGGEIVYKAIRYGRKKDKSDLLKVAAWAYLLWRYDQ